MTTPDFHRADRYLVRLGWTVLALTALATGCTGCFTEATEAASPERAWITWFALAAGLSMVAAGYILEQEGAWGPARRHYGTAIRLAPDPKAAWGWLKTLPGLKSLVALNSSLTAI